MLAIIDIGLLFDCANCFGTTFDTITCNCLVSCPSKINMLSLFCNALKSNGCILLVNHGVDESTIDIAVKASEYFFSNSLEYKMSKCSKDKARRGYSPLFTENFASLIGESNKPNDYVEKFRIGPTSVIDRNDPYYKTKNARIHFYENNLDDLTSDFKFKMTTYYEALNDLSIKLMKLIAICSELPIDFFSSMIDKPTSILSLNYYPPIDHNINSSPIYSQLNCTSNNKKVICVSEHTDVSLFTIVLQMLTDLNDKEFGGLEVYDTTTDQYLSVDYIPNSFILNIGDCLQYWSENQFKSAKHRVVMKNYTPVPNTDTCNTDTVVIDENYHDGRNSRLSLVYFFTPNYDAKLEWPLTITNIESENINKHILLPGQLKLDTDINNISKHNSDKKYDYSTWRKYHIKESMKNIKT